MIAAQKNTLTAVRSSGREALRGGRLWRGWLVANALGEGVGLVFPAAVGLWLAHRFDFPASPHRELANAAAMVLAGTMEGMVVGFAQWRVLRRVFPRLSGFDWVGWTAFGAAIAWIFGMAPSLFVSTSDNAANPEFFRLSETMRYMLAMVLGGALGPVLGFPQWLVLRRQVARAWWWIPANALAWMAGMPVIFFVAGVVAPETPLLEIGFWAVMGFALAGAVVGAIHGAVLVWLTQTASETDGRPIAALAESAVRHRQPSRETTARRLVEFEGRPWRAHGLLAGIPVHSLDRVELSGGTPGLTLREISGIVGFGGEVEMKVGPLTQFLFWLRTMIGRVLRWDDAGQLVEANSYLSRLTVEDRKRSVVQPGTVSGISRILYQFEDEMVGEIINRTVHCFWVMAVEPVPRGYVLWMAVYVKKLNWFTPVYMACISPMLKWVIYPSLLKGISARWAQESARLRSESNTQSKRGG